MNLLKYLKKKYAIYKLQRWAKSSYVPSKNRVHRFANGHDRIWTDQIDAFMDKVYVKRRCDMTSVCIDLYWIIKPERGKKHIYVLHKRCGWEDVLGKCKRGDTISLPKAIYYSYDKMLEKASEKK